MGNQVPLITLEVLNNSEDASDEDDGAGRIQHDEMSFPRNVATGCNFCRCLDNSVVEEEGCDDKETEDANLYPKSRDDELLADVVKVKCPG